MKTLSEQISEFFSNIVIGRFSQLGGWGAVQISIYDINIYLMQKNDHITNVLIDNYLLWLVKEVDDETAMKYIQKPSPDLPDDTVIAIFYTNVWDIFLLREYQEKLIKKMYFESPHGKSNPLVITMAYYKQFSSWEQSVNGINAFFKQLKNRSFDTALVEIVKTAYAELPNDIVLVKIHGDIWKKGSLFKHYQGE